MSLSFAPPTLGIRTASSLVTLNAVTDTFAAADTYQATAEDVNSVGWEFVCWRFVYTKGDETSIQIKPEGYNGTAWVPLGYKASQGSGVSEVTVDVLQMSATLSLIMPKMNCRGYQKVRCSIKSTGGTPTGTIIVTATAGISIAGLSA